MTRVTIKGLDRLRLRLERLPAEAEAAARHEVMRAALEVQAGAKRRVPVDTGRLRNSIAVETSSNELSATVGTNVEYSPYVEFGTRKMSARPFLFPAFEEVVRGKFVARLAEAVRKAVRR